MNLNIIFFKDVSKIKRKTKSKTVGLSCNCAIQDYDHLVLIRNSEKAGYWITSELIITTHKNMRNFTHCIDKAFLNHYTPIQMLHRAYLSKGGKKEKLVFIKGEVCFSTLQVYLVYLF